MSKKEISRGEVQHVDLESIPQYSVAYLFPRSFLPRPPFLLLQDTLSAEFDRVKGKVDTAIDASKNAKQSLKFRSVEEIDAEMSRLNKLQSTTSMTLGEEKKLVKELESLRGQKRQLSALGASEGQIKNDKDERARIQGLLKAKRDAFTECLGRLTAQREVCDAVQAKENGGEGGKKGLIPTLHDERNVFWKKKSEAITQIKAIREQVKGKWDEFKAARKEWEAFMDEERKVREAERRAQKEEWERKREEEEAKKIPFEEEMALCDYLSNYLKTTFLVEKETATAAVAAAAVAAAAGPAAAFEHDGMTLQAFRREDEEEERWVGGGKKKKEKKPEGGKKKNSSLTHSPELLASFALLKLDAPSKKDGVEAAVVALKEKKEWFSVQPRPIKKKAEPKEKEEGEEGTGENGEADPVAGEEGGNAGNSKGGKGKGGRGGEKKAATKEFKRSDDDFPTLGATVAAPAAKAEA